MNGTSVSGADAGVGGVVHDVRLGKVAHGGHVVARVDGRVVFVRHGLPGELVDVALTDTSASSFWRGDAVAVHEASELRTQPPCPLAGRCGGCDFQHVSIQGQRELKRQVVAEQMRRLAGFDWDGEVEEAPGAPMGLHWRTRTRFFADDDAALAMRVHRSHELVVLPPEGCPLGSSRLPDQADVQQAALPGSQVIAVGASRGRAILRSIDGRARPTVVQGDATVTERAAGRTWEVPATSFWQVHKAAADTLVSEVIPALAPSYGERAFDLYCGAGLFSGVLAMAGCEVWGVESAADSVEAARRNVPEGRFLRGKVETALQRLPRSADIVVLDPPRSGAGHKVVAAIVALAPRVVAYVSCDPATLARDLATFQGRDYRLRSLKSFDLFPMTHHIESVAILEREGDR